MKDDLTLMQFSRELAEFIQGLNKPEPSPAPDVITSQNKLAEVMLQAQNETGVTEYHTPGFEPKLLPRPAVATISLSLGKDLSPLKPQIDGIERNINLVHSENFTLSAAVAQAARTVQAGATLIVADEKYLGSTSGMHVFNSDAAIFRAIEAADLVTVNDGQNVDVSNLPFSDAAVQWRDDDKHLAATFKVNRRTRKGTGNAGIEYDILTGVVLGIAKAADKVLLSAIAALTPSTFSLGAAAARNLTYRELKGFVGTSGTGASIQECKLMAGNVPAELTQGTDQTIVGAFNRAAIAVHPDIRIVVKRLNAASDLEISVFANMQAVLPDASKTAFWKVA